MAPSMPRHRANRIEPEANLLFFGLGALSVFSLAHALAPSPPPARLGYPLQIRSFHFGAIVA